jgi:hypothetical protein
MPIASFPRARPVIKGSRMRYSVVDLKNNYPELFGRFIMALKNLINSDDWARICGIHGDTFKPGDTGVLCPTDPKIVTKIGCTDEPFYCKHSVYSFIAWHAPYVYQFELLLNKYNKSSNQDYITLPWLDLTDFNVDFSFLNDPEITIFYDKKQITTENPLAGAYYYVDGVRTRTTRGGYFTPTTKKQRMTLNTVKKQLNNALYAPNYEQFSSVPTRKKPSNIVVDYVPLETPHNSLHDIIGGMNGNMANIDIAAFDPIFWLHHCNMDRHYYTWTHRVTDGFKKSIYPDLMTEVVYSEPCAPFFKDYVYADDPSGYNWGWRNGTGEYAKVGDILQIDRFPYTYDLISPAPKKDLNAFVELIDIPIPQESLEFNVYLHLTGELLDRGGHFAGAAFWFGINRDKIDCCRCNVGIINIKIDIEEYVTENGITKDNIGNYNLVLEGEGQLIKDSSEVYKTYNMANLIKGGSYQIVLI